MGRSYKTKVLIFLEYSYNYILISAYYSYYFSLFFSVSLHTCCKSYKNCISIKSSIKSTLWNKYPLIFSIYKSKSILYYTKYSFNISLCFWKIILSSIIFDKLTITYPFLYYLSILLFKFWRPS